MKNEEKLFVLQVFGSLDMGGAESRMMDIFRALDPNVCCFDFVTLSSDDNQFYETEIKKLGGKIFKILSPRKIGIIKHINQLRACMKDKRYNAVHAHTSYHCGIVLFAAWLEHIPVRIAHARTNDSKQRGLLKILFVNMGKFLVNIFANRKIAISKDAGKFLFGKHTFEIIPNVIDTKKYLFTDQDKIIKLKSELNILNKFVIGQIGRFEIMKNHNFTVRWFHNYLKKNSESILVFVGDGSLKQGIIDEVDRLGISNNVIFTGIRNDVYELIHTFDVLFFPSIFEGLGSVAIESQAAGIPCIISDKIPLETDLGLGLIKRCSLSDSFDIWDENVNYCKNIIHPSTEMISSTFDKKGYSLDAVKIRYIKIYRGEKNENVNGNNHDLQ